MEPHFKEGDIPEYQQNVFVCVDYTYSLIFSVALLNFPNFYNFSPFLTIITVTCVVEKRKKIFFKGEKEY